MFGGVIIFTYCSKSNCEAVALSLPITFWLNKQLENYMKLSPILDWDKETSKPAKAIHCMKPRVPIYITNPRRTMNTLAFSTLIREVVIDSQSLDSTMECLDASLSRNSFCLLTSIQYLLLG